MRLTIGSRGFVFFIVLDSARVNIIFDSQVSRQWNTESYRVFILPVSLFMVIIRVRVYARVSKRFGILLDTVSYGFFFSLSLAGLK